MAEITEVLLKKKDKVEYYENCPGCKIDKLKESSHGLPYKHLFFLFIVVLAAGTQNSVSFFVFCKFVLSI